MKKQGLSKEMIQVLDAAASAMDEMERWRNIATMLSHFMTCNSRNEDCKHCALATQEYMQAKKDHAELEAEYHEIAMAHFK